MNRYRAAWTDHPVGDPRRGAPYAERLDPATVAVAAPYIASASAIVGIANATGMLGGAGGGSAPPPLAGPTVMPTPDDEAVRAARKKSLAAQATRRGRQSTILSNDLTGDLLGA